MDSFPHLHVASSYSMRYGATQPQALADRAAEYGMEALALTDRDGLYGAVKHVLACRQAGIRPILGADLALPDGDRVTLLARGRTGWSSLCRLVSAAHYTGERAEPMITRDLIAAHGDGLVALLGPGSDFGRAVTARRKEQARVCLTRWRTVIEPAEIAVEVVHHRGYGDAARAARMLRLAHEEDVPAVLSNAVRYLDPADAPVADVLDAARAVAPLEHRRVGTRSREIYLKSGKEMGEIAAEICGPDRSACRHLLATTRKLAQRLAIDPAADLGMGMAHLPELAGSGAGIDPYIELRDRCEAGLTRRGLVDSGDARARLADELTIIRQASLPAYFLTVADAAALIRAAGIRCAIRGSGASSLVTHLLGISEVDPLAHGLVMERFLSEGRAGLPDIDLDVESARRLDAYQAILDRYGEDRVACVSMMETYRARGAIREVGAALGLPPHEIDATAKAFPHVRASQIDAALTELPELRSSGLDQGTLSGVFRLARRLDGLPRHIAMHPCGIVLSDLGLHDRSPVERSYLGFPMTQYDKDDVEEMGLLKLDVLGVRMQSAMTHALAEVHRVREGGGEKLDIDAVPRDDPETYALIRSTRTLGCFQIESPGQRELVGKLEPADLDDLVLDISLFRPGPVSSDMVTPYLRARHGWQAPSYPHPTLAGILAETGGVVVYHEQVLRIFVVMTGCDLSQAEHARRALGDPVGGEEVRVWFQVEASRAGYDAETVERVWRVLAAFGAFGFCKAHATAFAVPTYQSAWLKTHHTAAFFAGVLTHDPGMYPKRLVLDDARQFGVTVLGLDVNSSGAGWQIEHLENVDGVHRYGLRVALSEVKGVSEIETGRVVSGRRHGSYRSLPDFWRRGGVSRPVVERIIEVGGFDSLYGIPERQPADRPGGAGPWWRPGHVTRRDLLAQVSILDRDKRRVPSGQCSLGAGEPDEPETALDAFDTFERMPAGELPEMTDRDRVRAELDILGVDVTRHVVSFYDDLLEHFGVVRARDLTRCRSGAEVLVAGAKVATQTPPVRSGQRVIFATLDDATGPVDVTFFESVQDECAATVFGSWLLVVRGRIRRTGTRAVSLRATGCWDLAELHRRWRAGTSPGHAGPVPESVPPRPAEPAASTGARTTRKLWHASPGSAGH